LLFQTNIENKREFVDDKLDGLNIQIVVIYDNTNILQNEHNYLKVKSV